VMRRRQEMEREAAVTLMSKKAGDSVSAVGSAGSTQKLDEPPTTTGRMVTRQNAPDDRGCNKTELAEKQKLRSAQLSALSGFPQTCKNLELSGNFVNLEKSGNIRYGQGIFCDMSHGLRLAYL